MVVSKIIRYIATTLEKALSDDDWLLTLVHIEPSCATINCKKHFKSLYTFITFDSAAQQFMVLIRPNSHSTGRMIYNLLQPVPVDNHDVMIETLNNYVNQYVQYLRLEECQGKMMNML